MSKIHRKKLNNQGNTFVVVMVGLACMGILVAVILASAGYFYRMRYVDLENKNNFYYVEKAMDEIYSGVGNDSTAALMSAYNDTVEVMVYYDPIAGNYVTIDEKAANRIMKQKFLQKLATDPVYVSQAELYNRLSNFISTEGVNLVDPATQPATEPRLFMEIVTSTTGVAPNVTTTYEKLIIHNVTVTRTTTEGYVQSITSDIVISEPEFDVAFSSVDNVANAIYDFSLIADMGIEFNEATKTSNGPVSVTGNIYAAADYYNKEYNESAGTRVSSYYGGTDTTRLQAANGINDRSRYSGLYNNGSRVSITAEKVIVPGSISVINDGTTSITGNITISSGLADVWADNIVMAPASVRTVGMTSDDGTLMINANTYIADDLEINNDNAILDLSGSYYGYNFSQTTDNQRVLSQYASSGKAHVNSSAIIVNGNNATVDFSGLSNLYVAGRAYIESSRTRAVTISEDGKTVTTNYIEVEGNTDVQTGESISIKSNQIAYMPLGVDTAGQPVFSNVYTAFNNTIIQEITSRGWVNPTNMTVVQTISDKDYYFLNFTSAAAATEFFNWYANEMPNLPGYAYATDIANVREYGDFNLTSLDINTSGFTPTTVTTSGAYSSGALNVANRKFLTVTSPTMDPLVGGESPTVTNFNARATEYNNNYMEMKYALQIINTTGYSDELLTAMQNLKNTIASANAEDVTPINYFLDFSKINGSGINGTKIGNYYVWISDGDVTVEAPAGTNGRVMGLIIAKGDIIFADDPTNPNDQITRFEGLVVSGSKIIVDHQIDFIANAEVVKTIQRTADATRGNAVGDYSGICEIFKDYEPSEGGSSDDTTAVGNIEVGDVLHYENWKKNVE